MAPRPTTPSVSTSFHPIDPKQPRLRPPYKPPPSALAHAYFGALKSSACYASTLARRPSRAPDRAAEKEYTTTFIGLPARPAFFRIDAKSGVTRPVPRVIRLLPHRRFRAAMVTHGPKPNRLLRRRLHIAPRSVLRHAVGKYAAREDRWASNCGTAASGRIVRPSRPKTGAGRFPQWIVDGSGSKSVL
jgi:hypothetical protein